MPEIEISADQREYLEDLRADLAERYVEGYGHVRPRDALQYLIDSHEGRLDGGRADGEAPADEPGGGGEGDGEEGTDAGAEGGEDAEPRSGADRLEAMMNLLDEHADKWEEDDGEEGKYAVTLPDGGVEHARTKDEVRALLFRHYR